MKKTLKTFLCLCLILCFASVSAFAGTQKVTSPTSTKTGQALTKNGGNYQPVVDTLQKYVKRNSNGTFTMNAPQSVLNKIDKEMLKTIESGMSMTNSEILKGELVSDSSLNVVNPKDKAFAIQGTGVNKIVHYWWGIRVYLSHNTCNKILSSAYAIGPIMAAIAFFVPPTAAGMIIGGVILGCGYWAISANDSGSGVIIKVFEGVPVWVSGQ